METSEVVRRAPIKGFPGYWVDTNGIVWTTHRPSKGTKPHPTAVPLRGWLSRTSVPYSRVVLVNGKKKRQAAVHHLVLEAFVGPRPDGQQCRHLSGDSLDNRLVNLRWGNCKENAEDRVNHGTQVMGETHGNARLTVAQVVRIREDWESGRRTQRELANEYGINQTMVSQIVRRTAWKHV